MLYYPEPLERLIEELQKLPGIGVKSAQRIAFHILRMEAESAKQLGKVISEVQDQIVYCSTCGSIVATNPNTQGQATAIYLSRKIKPLGIKITQLAHGLPMGGDIDYVDEVTLGKALEGRREI